MGRKDRMDYKLLKATETLAESMESRRNSSGTSSQDWIRQKFAEQIRRNTRKFHRKNSIHVDVWRHFLWNKRQWKRMSGKRSTRIFLCKEVWYRTLVILWSWFGKEVALFERGQSTRRMGQSSGKDVDRIRWEWMSKFPCYDSTIQRSTQKQRTW